jgi:hypothetical protein
MTDGLPGNDAVLRRLHSLAQTPPDGVDVEVIATPTECEALAKLNNLVAVDSLTAHLHVERLGAGLLVRGVLRAELRQSCVVTLEPFPARIEEDIRVRFAPVSSPEKPARSKRSDRRRDDEEEEADLLLDLEGEDPPEPLVGDSVDLGAVVAEFFTLALDPYPRKPGAAFVDAGQEGSEEAGADASPFAALRVLSEKKPD